MSQQQPPRRDGDQDGPVPVRSGRFYSENGQWFVTTREGKPMGPFATKEEAQDALSDFLDFIQTASPELLVSFFRQFLAGKDKADS